MMAKESGATSFIAMVQLPDKKLKEALAHRLMKVFAFTVLLLHRLHGPQTQRKSVVWFNFLSATMRCYCTCTMFFTKCCFLNPIMVYIACSTPKTTISLKK